MAAEIRSGAAGVARAIAAFCMLLLILGAGHAALAATIVGAAIEKDGPVVEMRFAIRGRGLHWRVSTHRQELWIDLSNTRMRIGARPFAGREASPVASVTMIDGGEGAARIVVGVIGQADYAVVRTARQLTLRLAPAGAVSNLAAPLLAATWSEAFASRRSSSLARSHPQRGTERISAAHPMPSNDRVLKAAPADRRPIVMIDPGHGGRDPGTESASGVAEKDVALQISLRLRSALIARGVDARLTRIDDTFIPLNERTRMANAAGADLFVSIHLNSSPDAATTGIESYYLNNTTDRATIRLARMENGVAGGYSAPGGPDLHYILTDLRQQYKANESASLARMIEAATVADAAAETGIRVNELGAKQGPFYVLVGALMPSVLVECGFLSNPPETRLLQSPAYQQAIADGIAQAVAHYFNADAAVGNL